MFVQMELARIIISEINDQQVIFLREVAGDRSFPILIGLFEATSIDRRVRGEISQRPLTHDLLKASIEAIGGRIQDVVIHSLEDHTYFAGIRIKKMGSLSMSTAARAMPWHSPFTIRLTCQSMWTMTC